MGRDGGGGGGVAGGYAKIQVLLGPRDRKKPAI